MSEQIVNENSLIEQDVLTDNDFALDGTGDWVVYGSYLFAGAVMAGMLFVMFIFTLIIFGGGRGRAHVGMATQKMVGSIQPSPSAEEIALANSIGANDWPATLAIIDGASSPHFTSREAMRVAIERENLAIIKELFKSKYYNRMVIPDQNWLFQAAGQGHLASVEFFLDKGTKADEYNSYALVQAVTKGHADVVKLLLERGAKPNARGMNRALAAARKAGHMDAVRLVEARLWNWPLIWVISAGALVAGCGIALAQSRKKREARNADAEQSA